MLPDDTFITFICDGERKATLLKSSILNAVRSLYLAESARTIAPDAEVRKQLAAELVRECLEPR